MVGVADDSPGPAGSLANAFREGSSAEGPSGPSAPTFRAHSRALGFRGASGASECLGSAAPFSGVGVPETSTPRALHGLQPSCIPSARLARRLARGVAGMALLPAALPHCCRHTAAAPEGAARPVLLMCDFSIWRGARNRIQRDRQDAVPRPAKTAKGRSGGGARIAYTGKPASGLRSAEWRVAGCGGSRPQSLEDCQ